MTRPGAAVLAAILSACVAPALAGEDQDDTPHPEEDEEEPAEPGLITPAGSSEPESEPPKDHHRQFGVGLQIPLGIRVIVPYDKTVYCGDRGENENSNAEACLGRTPASLDFALAFGIRPNLELLLELRLGLERDFGESISMSGDGPRLFRWSPGVKFYFSEAKLSKLFSTAQLAFDHTGYDQRDDKADFFLRNLNGLQLDFHPSYGLYFFVGEALAFRRWLQFGVELGVGIQGRYP